MLEIEPDYGRPLLYDEPIEGKLNIVMSVKGTFLKWYNNRVRCLIALENGNVKYVSINSFKFTDGPTLTEAPYPNQSN